MDLHPAASYWDRGVRNVPDMTGAKTLLDAHDLRAVCAEVGIDVPIQDSVLDIGCGTGRLAQLCAGSYRGYDIAPSAVMYCRDQGIHAELLLGPDDELPAAHLITCISVFTHISREERQRYLSTFHSLAPRVLVDIIPGQEGGETRLWTADDALFRQDLADAGFVILSVTDHQWGDQPHRYFYVEGV